MSRRRVERTILEFPPASAIVGDVVFGDVAFDGSSDVASSQYTLEDNADGFHADALRMLHATATFANVARMVINLVRNADFENFDNYFTEGVGIQLSATSVTELSALPSSTELPIRGIGIGIYSHDFSTKAAG